MELQIDRQILEAAATLLTGLGLGAVYEVFGVLRRRCGIILAAALDMGFCLLFAWSLFLLGMGPGGGTLRLYMPALALGGGAFWVYLFGAATRRCTGAVLNWMGRGLRFLAFPLKKTVKNLKKLEKYLKNIFSSAKKWFTIIRNHATRLHRQPKPADFSGETDHETEAFRYTYEDRDSGTSGVRRDPSVRHKKPHRAGRV